MAITINGTGSITGLTAGGLPDGSIVAGDLASSLDLTGKTVTLPSGTGGKVLQVVSTVFTSQAATNSNSWQDYTSASITPSSNSSKVLIAHNVTYGGQGNSYGAGRCYRSGASVTNEYVNTGTSIYWAESRFTDSNYSLQMDDSNGDYKMCQGHFYFLDSPNTTTEVTYTFAIHADNSNRFVYINRSGSNPGNGYAARANTVTVLMEVAP